jgi:hypothetical protein
METVQQATTMAHLKLFLVGEPDRNLDQLAHPNTRSTRERQWPKKVLKLLDT